MLLLGLLSTSRLGPTKQTLQLTLQFCHLLPPHQELHPLSLRFARPVMVESALWNDASLRQPGSHGTKDGRHTYKTKAAILLTGIILVGSLVRLSPFPDIASAFDENTKSRNPTLQQKSAFIRSTAFKQQVSAVQAFCLVVLSAHGLLLYQTRALSGDSHCEVSEHSDRSCHPLLEHHHCLA